MNRDEFARMIRNLASRIEGVPSLKYDATRFALIADDGTPLSLHYGYHEYCRTSASERSDVIDRTVRSCLSLSEPIPGNFAEACGSLLPQIRTRTECDLVRLKAELTEQPDSHEPHRVLAQHFAITLVRDRPTCMLRVSQRHLDELRLTYDEALKIACENLLVRSDANFKRLSSGLWASPWEDNYDAARILLPQVIQRCPTKGTPIVMLSNRSTLVVADSDDLTDLDNLCSWTGQELDSPLVLSGIPLQLDNGDCRPFVPSEAHPLYQQFRMLWVKSLCLEYSGQTRPLMTILGNYADEEAFMASLFPSDGADLQTCCSWTKGVHALLPKSDIIHFEEPASDYSQMMPYGSSTWEQVQEVVGDLLEPLGCYPERYRVRQFPTAKQLNELVGGDGAVAPQIT